MKIFGIQALEQVRIWITKSINRLKLMQKMKAIKYLAIAFLALSAVSCEEPFVEEINPNDPEKQEFVVKQITLEAQKSNEEISRIYIGSADAEKGTIYHWNEDDHVGVFAMNSGAVDKNYEGTIKGVYQNNKNNARFEAFVNYDPETTEATEATDLLVYWPYNSSNVVTGTDTDVPAYLAKTGVQIRTLNQQNQSVYNPIAGENNATEHPSVNISKYGAAYDMTTCDKDGHAKFTLHHATAYLQFNLVGADKYGAGNYEVASIIVRLGKVAGQVSQGLLANGATFTPVQIAGNFTYHIPTYNKGEVKADDVKLLKSGGDETVMVSLAEPQKLDAANPVPVFAVVNASNVTTANVNAIEAVVTVVEKNANGSPINSYTRTRYINLGRNTIKGGDYYTIKFTVNDPVEEAARLDNLGGSNCYIIPYPGKYLFDVSYPGNGVMPAHTTDYATLGLGDLVDANGKFFTEETMDNYEVRYLWASGTSFDKAAEDNAEYNLTDDQVVAQVVEVERYAENVMLTVKNTGEDLNGNLVVALCKKGSREVVWSWHLWFARPSVQYFKYPATRPTVGINNEDWYMFDRNVGAETAELGNPLSYGLYYQLGRHTPFITPSGNGSWPTNRIQKVYVNQYFTEGQRNWGIEYMANGNSYPYARPMTMNSAESRSADGTMNNIYTYAWVSSDNAAADNSKTFFDPCPLGYKLPTTREWDNLKENQFEKTQPAATNSGVFGYAAPRNVHQNDAAYVNDSHWTETTDVYDSLVAVHGDFAAILNERMAAGNKFEHLADGRTYISTTLSGSGTPITTNFPNTGVIEVSGTTATAKYMADGDATLDHDANFVLWAAGRLELPVDDNGYLITNPEEYPEGWVAAFSPHWFGPMDWYNDSFAPLKVDGSYTDWTCWAPWWAFEDTSISGWARFSVQRAYGTLGTRPYNISGIDGTWGNDNQPNSLLEGGNGVAPKNSGNYAGQAAPVRCIREYNSTSATAEE